MSRVGGRPHQRAHVADIDPGGEQCDGEGVVKLRRRLADFERANFHACIVPDLPDFCKLRLHHFGTRDQVVATALVFPEDQQHVYQDVERNDGEQGFEPRPKRHVRRKPVVEPSRDRHYPRIEVRGCPPGGALTVQRDRPWPAFASRLLGELRRLDDYAAVGDISTQEVPARVREA